MLFAAYIKMRCAEWSGLRGGAWVLAVHQRARLPTPCPSQSFGATIFISIGLSFLYAMGFFIPLLLEFGPLPPVATAGPSAVVRHSARNLNGDANGLLTPTKSMAKAIEERWQTGGRLFLIVAIGSTVIWLMYYAINPATA